MAGISDEERRIRAEAAVVAEQLNPQHGIYYSSFAAETGWLGGCFIEADGPVHSIRLAHQHGCNPGGEVQTWGPIPLEAVPEEHRNRLLSGEEGKRIIQEMG